MFILRKKLKKMDMGGGGVIRQYLGECTRMNAQHWDMANKSIVAWHAHPQEQFGYVIKGGFKMKIGKTTKMLKSGDAYFIPPGVPHEFVAVGSTEAIDIFSPIKKDFPWMKKKGSKGKVVKVKK